MCQFDPTETQVLAIPKKDINHADQTKNTNETDGWCNTNSIQILIDTVKKSKVKKREKCRSSKNELLCKNFLYWIIIYGMLDGSKNDFTKSTNLNNYIKTTKVLRRIRNINAINFNSFQRKSKNTLNYASMGRLWCFLLISNQ